MSIFISSGEASGDHYAAKLAQSLRASGYSGDIWGMGGIESRSAGLRAEWHGERLQLLGFTEVLSAIPSIFALRNDMVKRIMETSPKAVIVVDSPDYHMRLIAKLRRCGFTGRIFYISPPAVWAWRSGRAEDLKANVDECLPLFKFEHDYLKSRGCRSFWTGYPLLEEFSRDAMELQKPPRILAEDDKLVAFLPGSRGSEVNSLLPMMEETACKLKNRGWHPVFSVAPGLNPKVRNILLERFESDGTDYYEGPGRDLMAAARCAVGASGTITVESLLLGCYMIVTYKVNPISAMLARMIINTEHFAMANILAGSEIFPEFLQHRATCGNVLTGALKWLEGDGDFASSVKAEMAKARATLGLPGVYKNWTDRILEAV